MPKTTDYSKFLESKRIRSTTTGLTTVPALHSALFPFQRDIVRWALSKGRAAIFADCGLGKTPMQLDWARVVCRETGGRVLILTPLAVSFQTVREGEKFHIEAVRSTNGKPAAPITIANYERLELFNPSDYAGLVCDESSILKSFDGVRRKEITAFMRQMRYRLLCTATAAPNDYIELGTSSEALGEMGHVDMLNRFFINKNKTSDTKGRWRGYGAPREFAGPGWRFKGHAEIGFWRWVCSWARAIRKPSDIGHDDGPFILPELRIHEHPVRARRLREGMLFAVKATNLHEQREERRRTIAERCEMAAEIANNDTGQVVLWCHLNDEGDLLTKLVNGAEQVKGNDRDDVKESRLLAFANGESRVLVTKPKIGAWGLNLQGCSRIVYFPSHSYEQYYQAIRRCWRFGQQNPVDVHMIYTDGDGAVISNLQRKAAAADIMFGNLVAEMNRATNIKPNMSFTNPEEVPQWLSRNNGSKISTQSI